MSVSITDEQLANILSWQESNTPSLEYNGRLVAIAEDSAGQKVVVISSVAFKGRQRIDWRAVEASLRRFVGITKTVTECGHEICIGSDFPDEYAGSRYTARLSRVLAKAKANATNGIPEMIEIASGGAFNANKAEKHRKDAPHGWRKYDTRFALPVYNSNGLITRWNFYQASLVVRINARGKFYLYDMVGIKKETGTPLELTERP